MLSELKTRSTLHQAIRPHCSEPLRQDQGCLHIPARPPILFLRDHGLSSKGKTSRLVGERIGDNGPASPGTPSPKILDALYSATLNHVQLDKCPPGVSYETIRQPLPY